jgi:transposase, IS5 family
MLVLDQHAQIEFSDQFFHPMDDPVPPDHKYLRLRDALDRERIFKELGEEYEESKGRPSKPVMNMILLLLIKHMEGLSDRELMEKLAGSLPMQKALNLTYRAAQDYIDPSTLTYFRARIGEKGALLLADIAAEFVKKKGSRNRKRS